MGLRTSFSSLAPPERTRFIYTSVGFMCVASAALVARTVGDALFLSRYSPNLLSYMYIGTAVVVAAAAYTYGVCAGRISIGRLIVRTCAVLILCILGLRLALISPWGGFRIAAYLLSDLLVNVPMMLFWSFAALVFNPREAKRLFGFVGAAGTFACILAGFLVRPFAARFGTDNLLLLVGLLIGGFLIVIVRLSSLETARLQPSAAGGGQGRGPSHIGYYAGLLKTVQIRSLVLLVLAATVTLTLVDYQFKAGARLQYQGAELAGFFGSFYAYASVVALLIQLFLVHRILQKGGVLLGLLILPAGLLLTSSGTAFTALFSWMVATKLVVQIFAFTIDSAALQMLYLGVQKQSRSQARAFVEGIGRPLSMAATGLALVGAVNLLPLHTLAVGGAVASLLWLLLVRSNSRAYVSALVDSLGARRFDLSQETANFHDKTFESRIREGLTSAPDDEIPYLLDLLPEMEHIDWTPEFRALLKREDPDVKIAALRYLQERGNEDDLNTVLAHTRHPDPAVRAAAIYAAAALGDAIEDIERGLEDNHPTVRAASVASLINSGDLDRLLAAGIVLKDMLESETADVRIAAADALAHIQHKGLTRPIIGLLQDADDSVRLAALDACKRSPDPLLIPAVIPLLADPSVAPAAAETLSEFGSEALDHLVPYLELSRMEGAFAGAHRVPAILAKIEDLNALPALLKAAGAPDVQLRGEAIRAYCRLLRSVSSIKPYLSDLEKAAKREIVAATQRQQRLEEVGALANAEVLRDALRGEYNSHLQNAFTLLDACTQGVDMNAVYLSLGVHESRANALEILDNVLEGDLKSSLLSLLESGPEKTGPAQAAASRVLSLLQAEGSEWVTVGALYTAATNHIPGAREPILNCLAHPRPAVRETALYALSEFEEPDDLLEACTKLAEDPDPGVRRLAKILSSA